MANTSPSIELNLFPDSLRQRKSQNQNKVGKLLSCHKDCWSAIVDFFLSETLQVVAPERVELGQRREVVVVHLHDQVVPKVERLQTENTSIKQNESRKATLENEKNDNELRD